MLTPEEFKTVSDAILAEETLTPEQAKALLATVYELDAGLVIVQNALELSVANAQEVIPAVAEKVLSMAGRTDSKSKKSVAKFAAEITARFEIAIQMYLAGANEQAEEMLAKIAAGETLETTTGEEPINE